MNILNFIPKCGILERGGGGGLVKPTYQVALEKPTEKHLFIIYRVLQILLTDLINFLAFKKAVQGRN